MAEIYGQLQHFKKLTRTCRQPLTSSVETQPDFGKETKRSALVFHFKRVFYRLHICDEKALGNTPHLPHKLPHRFVEGIVPVGDERNSDGIHHSCAIYFVHTGRVVSDDDKLLGHVVGLFHDIQFCLLSENRPHHSPDKCQKSAVGTLRRTV